MAPPFLEYTVLVTVHKVLTAPKYIAPASTIALHADRNRLRCAQKHPIAVRGWTLDAVAADL
jgi:hypothetical protein